MARQGSQSVPLNGDQRPRRNVVEHDRQLSRVGNCGEVRHQPALRRPRVIRSDHQQTMGTLGSAGLGQVHAVRGVVATGAGDDAGTVTDGVQHRAQQGEFLGIGGGRRFPGGSGQHQSVAPGVDETVSQAAGGLDIHRAIGGEGGRHRGQNRAQPGTGIESAAAHGDLDYSLDPRGPQRRGVGAGSVTAWGGVPGVSR